MDFFKTKKKKAAPKPAANLNVGPEKDAIEKAAENAKAGAEREDAKKEAAGDASPSKMPTIAMDLRKVEAEKKKQEAANEPGKQWGSAPNKDKAGPQQFVIGANNPGAMNARKYPELMKANQNTNVVVGVNIGAKAEVKASSNRFANMEADGDCDDENDEKKEVVVLAHAVKKKGETIASTLDREIEAARVKTGAKADIDDEDDDLTDSQRKALEEKERKKQQKKEEAERKKVEIRENMKAIKKGDDKPTEKVEGLQADYTKFMYSSFSTVSAAEKYEGRMKRDWIAPEAVEAA